jgi:gamma-glutamyltranspeptidase/glutathione hydrolase
MVFSTRPTLRGFGGAVSAGHYLATQIGAQMLAGGGNAADAACAMGLAEQILEPHMNGPAGEVPILVRPAGSDRVHAISGQGVAPAAATIESIRKLGRDRIPGSGLLGATVPGALDAWCLLLEHFGTRTFDEISGPARALAENGHPLEPFLRDTLLLLEERFHSLWPSSAAIYSPTPAIGARVRNPAWAAVLAEMASAERRRGGGREAGVRAARDFFYRGRPAQAIDAFAATAVPDEDGRRDSGVLCGADRARYAGRIEEALSIEAMGAKIWKCGPWSQGPVFLQQTRLVDGIDCDALRAADADALHHWIECAKLSFADREANYGDPLFAVVPLERLLSPAYAEERRRLIDPHKASLEIRPGIGALPDGWPWVSEAEIPAAEPQAFAAARGRGDTTHLDAVDREGNIVAATPSGGWIMSSPVIPELGIPLGTRGQMFCLDPEHPNALAPGKRPRTTLTPSQATLPDGRHIAFGTPGGDQQDQWTHQFLLRLLGDAPDELQPAIDAPTVNIHHVPSSFYPRLALLGAVAAEARISGDTIESLQRRGHRVVRSGAWEHGRVMAVTRHPESGLCESGASPRSTVAYALTLP